MQSNIRLTLRRFFRRINYFIPVFFLAGLLLGAFLAASANYSNFSLTLLTKWCSMPVVYSLVLAVFPFTVTAYGCYKKLRELNLGCLFLTAAFHSFIGCSIYYSFSHAGWLMQPILQFPFILSLGFLLWFCLQNPSTAGKRGLLQHAICLLAVTAAVIFYHFVVLPFGVSLIEIYSGRYAYSCWI